MFKKYSFRGRAKFPTGGVPSGRQRDVIDRWKASPRAIAGCEDSEQAHDPVRFRSRQLLMHTEKYSVNFFCNSLDERKDILVSFELLF